MRWKQVAMVALVLMAAFSGGSAAAAEPDAVVPLWPGDGLPPGVTVQDPQNQAPDAQGLIRRMDKPELRVFLPPADRATGTAVIICPGGGYGLLDYKAHVAEFVADYQREGIAVIALLYKVPTTANLALTEGQRAIRLVRSHAKEWKIDPQKIGMQGYSAGSHLLVNLLAHADDGNPNAKDPLDRLSCRPNFVALMCPWNIWKVDKYAFKPPLPPVFLACADDDKVSIDFSDPLAARLKQLQTPVLYWRVHGGGHSAFHRPSPWGKWIEQLLPWLRQQGFAVKPGPIGTQTTTGGDTSGIPPGAAALGYTKRVINETPTAADVAPGKNGNYKWFSGQWYAQQVPSLDHYRTEDGILAVRLGGDLVSTPRDFSASALPLLSGKDGFYVEFDVRLSDNDPDHWPAVWLMPAEHDGKRDHYEPDPPGFERFMELDVDEGGFGPGLTGTVHSTEGVYPKWKHVQNPNNVSSVALDRSRKHTFGAGYDPARHEVTWWVDRKRQMSAGAPYVPAVAAWQHFYLILSAQAHKAKKSYTMFVSAVRAYASPRSPLPER